MKTSRQQSGGVQILAVMPSLKKITSTCKKDSHVIKLLRQYLDADELTKKCKLKFVKFMECCFCEPINNIIKQKHICWNYIDTLSKTMKKHSKEKSYTSLENCNIYRIGNYLSVSLANKICVN